MKIACIASSQVPARTANSIQVMKACQALAQVNGPVRLWLPGGRSAAWNELAAHYGLDTPFEITWLRSRRWLRRYDLVWQALRQARAWGAELVYTWLPAAALLALRDGLPAVLELHDRPSGRLAPWWFRRFVRQPGKKRLLVITAALRRRLEQDCGLPTGADWVQIAPNGADLDRYEALPDAAALRQELGLPPGLLVAYTGHFYAGRGAELLFQLAQRFPQVHFLWAGGRPEELHIWQARLEAAGVRNVLLTGFIENRRLPRYQAAADILLMPYERAIAGSSGGDSAEICSPMKMFDYLAARRAILSSDLPVLHEVLNESNAVFCPPEDVDAWQQALAALLADAGRRWQLGQQARRDAQRYTWRGRAERALQGMGL